MRVFHGLMFLGNPTSSMQASILHARLNEGIEMQGGLQQGVPTDSEEYKKGTADVADVIRDLAAALLGREINFGDALPYPPMPSNAPVTTYHRVFLNGKLVPEKDVHVEEDGVPVFRSKIHNDGVQLTRVEVESMQGSSYRRVAFEAPVYILQAGVRGDWKAV